jgi:dTDP-4-amino-4,6-dideoxygalactose transaminase
LCYYRERFGYKDEAYPNAAWVSDRLVSLPLFPQMTADEVDGVVAAVKKVVQARLR